MIEINLLPGARKKAKRSSPSIDFGGSMRDLASRINDPWMLGAVGSVIVGVAAIGVMWTIQGRRETSLTEREQKAVQDSTRFASVIAERAKAEAQRDSVKQQITVIAAIDGTRLVWPHVLDEIYRAMENVPYIWLRSMTSTPVAAEAPEIQAGVAPRPKKKDAPPVPAGVDENALKIQLVGNTVDIQALTRFIRALEASPFLQNVQLVRSDVVMQQGKEATEFRLDMEYEKPSAGVIRTVPLTVQVR